jgi:hypothetical protein
MGGGGGGGTAMANMQQRMGQMSLQEEVGSVVRERGGAGGRERGRERGGAGGRERGRERGGEGGKEGRRFLSESPHRSPPHALNLRSLPWLPSLPSEHPVRRRPSAQVQPARRGRGGGGRDGAGRYSRDHRGSPGRYWPNKGGKEGKGSQGKRG